MAVIDQPLAEELATFEAHRAELVASSPGKYALVKGTTVHGVYETEMDAVRVGYETFGVTPFLVKLISDLDEPIQISSLRSGL